MQGFQKADVGSHELLHAGQPALITPAEYAGLSEAQKALVAQIAEHAGWRPVVLHYGRALVAARHGSGQDISVEDTPNWEAELDRISRANATGKEGMQP